MMAGSGILQIEKKYKKIAKYVFHTQGTIKDSKYKFSIHSRAICYFSRIRDIVRNGLRDVKYKYKKVVRLSTLTLI